MDTRTTPTLTYGVQAHIVQPGVSEVHAKQATIAFDTCPQVSDELLATAFRRKRAWLQLVAGRPQLVVGVAQTPWSVRGD